MMPSKMVCISLEMRKLPKKEGGSGRVAVRLRTDVCRNRDSPEGFKAHYPAQISEGEASQRDCCSILEPAKVPLESRRITRKHVAAPVAWSIIT